MTVKQLIKTLEQFPPDHKVVVENKGMRDEDFYLLKASLKYNRTYDFTCVVLET